jgi:deoxycytidine triphosphate deaminase
MSTLISTQELRQIVADPAGFIRNGDVGCVEGIKYDFRLGGTFLKAKHGVPLAVSAFSASEGENVRVDPGETVFVLTEETLHLPQDVKAEISHKRKLAHLGILVLGGFCIDPQYEGHLLFGLYNFSSEPFRLQPKKKLVAAQFYRLTPEEYQDLPVPKPIHDFPNELQTMIGRFVGTSTHALAQRVEDLSRRMQSLQSDFSRREEWYEKNEKMIEGLERTATTLNESLALEVQERKSNMDKLSEQLTSINELSRKHDHDIAVQRIVGITIVSVITFMFGLVGIIIGALQLPTAYRFWE